ncbi:hypothetical protein BD410DRAFT_788617 [Rickenella mellea]|uniref:F-box domain-containing protein n=1 Tax=Rickenella mellea TaxID=50990 RepID=A0A4Y7Q4N9_9AGAM|nr:hypothetical protein BD410DRAFT_788617 [Rickenella mellea]
MSSLPNEILSHIFEICFLNQDTQNLGCIRPWRDCALSTRLLWSKLSVGLMAGNSWLDRAGQIPLSIDLYYGEPEFDHEALEDVFTPSRNWKAVSLEVYEPTYNPCVQEILEAVLIHAPMLESFSIRLTGIVPSESRTLLVPTRTIEIGFTPRLSTISVHPSYRFRLSLSNVHVYGNIRDLTLRWPKSISHCLHILERCPNVEVLRISLTEEQPPPPRTVVLTLKKLHTLNLCGYVDGAKDFGDFLDGLTTPSLAELTIQVGMTFKSTSPRHWPNLFQLLVRSQPPLKTLTLMGTHMTANTIVDCLRNTPQLTVISGDKELFSPIVMDALTPSLQPLKVALCPMLRVIGVKGEPASLPALTWMIYSRWKLSKQKLSGEIYEVQSPAVDDHQVPRRM